MAANGIQRLGEKTAAVGVDFFDNSQQFAPGVGQILVLLGKGMIASVQLVQFRQGLDVYVAQVVDLSPQVFDFLLNLFSMALFLLAGLELQFG